MFRSGETMKTVRRLGMTSVFSLLLATATFAGEISTPKAPPPPPPGPSLMTPGETDTGRGTQNPQETSESVADIVLNLLQSMLAVF
jgi:hypothetical protein